MTIQAFHDLVRQLKEQTNELNIEDSERKQYLTELIESLEKQILLEQGIKTDHIITEQLEEKLLQYEVEHPDIASVLGQLIEILKSMGI